MIRIQTFIISLLLLAQNLYAQGPTSVDRPKLVVGLMVDQMRWDYLYRYYDRYQEGGFKRILREGFSNENTYIDHLPTVTAIGHSCVYTGSVPAITGITGNDFIIQQTGQRLYCAEDSSVQGVGTSGKGGQMSPKNLLASTVTDELKLATNFRSKVIGIAFKDRSSIMPAGHFADAAYWFDDQANWITSSYYMNDLPAWVKKFNSQKRSANYLKDGWNTFYPADTYVQSSPDDNPYEGPIKGSKRPILPISAETLKNNGARIIYSTPFGNTFTLDFAKEAIRQEQLGHNPENVTDFLAISLSSTDAIGHQYGVNALEVEDMYLRLDQDLAHFFQFLDETIGTGEYTFFLTADHGASHNNPFFIDHKGSGGYISKDLLKDLNQQLLTQFGADQLIRSFDNDQVHLNYSLIAQQQLDEAAIRSFLVNQLRKVTGVAFAVDMDKVGSSSVPQPIRQRIMNSYHYKRSGVIQIIFDPQWKTGSPNQTGTGHSAWNPYDAHIPLLWLGWGIPQGSSNEVVSMYDIAPTIAAMLHIQEPNGNVGKPISFSKK